MTTWDYEGLSQLMLGVVKDDVRAALRQSLAEEASGEWLKQAAAVLNDIDTDTSEPVEAGDELRAELAEACASGIEVREDDVQHFSEETAELLISSWIEVLDLALERQPRVMLQRGLLPRRLEGGLKELLPGPQDGLLITTDRLTPLFEKFEDRLMAPRQTTCSLPEQIILVRGSDGQRYVTREI